MGIGEHCKKVIEEPAWKGFCVGASVLERMPRALIPILALLGQRGMRCPLLCNRLCERVANWGKCCQGVGGVCLCLRDYLESAGGKRFDGELLDKLSDGSALAASSCEGAQWLLELLAVEVSVRMLTPLQKAIGCVSLWGAVGEPLFGFCAQIRRFDCSKVEWNCMTFAKAMEAVYQATGKAPVLSACGSMVQGVLEQVE